MKSYMDSKSTTKRKLLLKIIKKLNGNETSLYPYMRDIDLAEKILSKISQYILFESSSKDISKEEFHKKRNKFLKEKFNLNDDYFEFNSEHSVRNKINASKKFKFV